MPEWRPGWLACGVLWVGCALGCSYPGSGYVAQPVPRPDPTVLVGPPAPATAEAAPARPVESPAADANRERLLAQANVVLDALEARSPAEARREADRLRALFPGNDGELLEALLRRRIDRVKCQGGKERHGNPAAAKEE